MSLIFKKIVIHNFMSIADEDINFDSLKGFNLIIGENKDIPSVKNGAGKSSLMHSLVYALYGEIPSKIHKNIRIVNRNNTDGLMEITLFLSSNGTDYCIKSGIRKKAAFCNVFEYDDKGTEKNITLSTVKETRSFIENKIVGCNKMVFMRTIFLNSDDDYDFFRLESKDRKVFTDKLFGLEIYGVMFNEIHSDVLKIKKDLAISENKIITLQSNKDNQIDLSNSFNSKKNQDITILKKAISELENRELVVQDQEIQKCNNNIEKCTKAIEQLTNQINDNTSKLYKVNTDISLSKNIIKNLERTIKQNEIVLNKDKELTSKLCSDCKDIFNKYHNLDKTQKEYLTNKKSLEQANLKLSQQETKVDEIKEKITSLTSSHKKLTDGLAKYREDVEKKLKDIVDSKMKLERYKSALKIKEESVDPYIDSIRQLDEELRAEGEINEKLTHTYRTLNYSENIVGEDHYKKLIRAQMINGLNIRINHYLNRLGADYTVDFDDEMEVTFIPRDKGDAELNNYSKGEQQRIKIATCLAFKDFLSTGNGITSNILVVDEFIDKELDEMSIDILCDILQEYAKNEGKNIFIITHKTEVKNKEFDNVIYVVKENGNSTIKIN